MAWTWNIDTFSPYETEFITGTTERAIAAYWERYEVRMFQIPSSIGYAEVTLSFEEYAGNPIGYLIALEDLDTVANHLNNTTGVPNDYVAKFTASHPVTVDIDDTFEYGVVIRAASSTDVGRTVCRIGFVDEHITDRYFLARVGSSGWNSIYVEVKNYGDIYYGFEYELTPTNDRDHPIVASTNAYYYTFPDLSSGTYEVRVYHYYRSDRPEVVRTSDLKAYIVITLEQKWQVWPGIPQDDLGRITTLYSREFSGTYERTLYRYRMTFPGTGRVTFSSSGNISRLNLDAWLSDSTQSLNYDRSTGVPDASRASDTSSNNHFSITYNCTEGRTYYLWFKNKEGTSSSEEFIININPVDFQSWAYDTRYADQFELEEVTVPEVTLQNKIGARFRFSCSGSGTVRIQPYNTGAYAYVTTDDYGFDPVDGIPYSNSAKTVKATGSRNLTYSVTGFAQYYLWIRGTSSEGYDTCKVTITPPTVTYTWQTDDQTGDTSVQNLSRDVSNKLITITRNVRNHIAYTLKYAVSFSRTGKAVFSSSNISSTGTMKLNAYVGSQDGNIDRDNGVPLNYSKMAQGNNNFRLELNVTAGTTYYLWIKASSPKVDGTARLGIIVPQDTGTTKGVWINAEGTNSTWTKTKVWLNTDATDAGWVRVKPDIFDSETNIWIVGS